MTHADPEREVIDYYQAAYIGALAGKKPTKIDTGPPQSGLSGTTWLQVESDGTPSADGYHEWVTVRVVFHAPPGRRSDAKEGAALAAGLLGIHPGNERVAGTKQLLGRSRPTIDPTTKNVMCWFTFRVTMRPLKVAV